MGHDIESHVYSFIFVILRTMLSYYMTLCQANLYFSYFISLTQILLTEYLNGL